MVFPFLGGLAPDPDVSEDEIDPPEKARKRPGRGPGEARKGPESLEGSVTHPHTHG